MTDSKKNNDFERRWKLKFERLARQYDDDAEIAGWSKTGLQARFDFFASQWSPLHQQSCRGTLWLDAGCGAGTYTRFLRAYNCDVIGLDYSQASLHKAKLRSERKIHWVAGDIRNLPFKDGEFDGIICFGVIQTLSSSEKIIEELARNASSNGEVWIDILNVWYIPNLLTSILHTILPWRKLHVRYESPFRIKRLLQKNGFPRVQILWVLIPPARPLFLKEIMQSPRASWLIRTLPILAILFCHSTLFRASRS